MSCVSRLGDGDEVSSWRIRPLFAFLAQVNVRALTTLIWLLRRLGSMLAAQQTDAPS